MASKIRVGKVVEEFCGGDGERSASDELSAYVCVAVTIDGEHRVGTMVGVPEYLHGTVRAAGCGVRPHCTAWQVDSSDMETVPREWREVVRDALCDVSWRLWREVESMREER